MAYDVSRYSSLAKALGYAIKNKYNMGESVVVTSGRASGDLIVMTANTGIPMVVTTKSPIYSGYVAAITYKVTLITISRRSGEVKLRVLTYPERVVTPSPHPWEALRLPRAVCRFSARKRTPHLLIGFPMLGASHFSWRGPPA